MRTILGMAALAMATGLATSSAAQTPPDGIVWIALRDINDYYADPDDPTNRPPVVTIAPDGMIVAVNVSDDGKPDWLIDYEHDGTGQFCGTGGCQKRLYVSDGDHYVRAFDTQALEFTVSAVGGERRLEAWVHHNYCGPGSEECRYAYAWDPALLRLVQRPNSRGETVLSGGGIDPVDREGGDPDRLPQTLSQEWYGGRMTCPDYSDAGFETRRPTIRGVPDMNGDGRRDWLLERPMGCDNEQSPPFEIWFSEGEDAVSAFSSAFNEHASIDIGVTPAVLVVNPPCGYGEPCPNRRLRWDARERRFVEAR